MSNIAKINHDAHYWTVPDFLYEKHLGKIVRNHSHKDMPHHYHTFVRGESYIGKLCLILSQHKYQVLNLKMHLYCIVLIGDEKIIVPRSEISMI